MIFNLKEQGQLVACSCVLKKKKKNYTINVVIVELMSLNRNTGLQEIDIKGLVIIISSE